MFVIADRRLLNPKMIEQLLRLASVLASDEVALLQHADRTQGDVLEIADWRGHEVKSGRKFAFSGHTGECSIEAAMSDAPCLIVFGGLPGVGKTTIAAELARQIGAVHVRIDSIEQALRASGSVTGPMDDSGYRVAYGVVEENLRSGRSVIADCVNPIQLTREAWREIARRCGAVTTEVEITCSDQTEHSSRVEDRHSDIPGFTLPTWEDVLAREYEPWNREHLVLDSSTSSVDESVAAIRRILMLK